MKRVCEWLVDTAVAPSKMNLGTRLSSKPVEHEVTAAFAGGAVLLLLAGGALSLSWFGRAL